MRLFLIAGAFVLAPFASWGWQSLQGWTYTVSDTSEERACAFAETTCSDFDGTAAEHNKIAGFLAHIAGLEGPLAIVKQADGFGAAHYNPDIYEEGRPYSLQNLVFSEDVIQIQIPEDLRDKPMQIYAFMKEWAEKHGEGVYSIVEASTINCAGEVYRQNPNLHCARMMP